MCFICETYGDVLTLRKVSKTWLFGMNTDESHDGIMLTILDLLSVAKLSQCKCKVWSRIVAYLMIHGIPINKGTDLMISWRRLKKGSPKSCSSRRCCGPSQQIRAMTSPDNARNAWSRRMISSEPLTASRRFDSFSARVCMTGWILCIPMREKKGSRGFRRRRWSSCVVERKWESMRGFKSTGSIPAAVETLPGRLWSIWLTFEANARAKVTVVLSPASATRHVDWTVELMVSDWYFGRVDAYYWTLKGS